MQCAAAVSLVSGIHTGSADIEDGDLAKVLVIKFFFVALYFFNQSQVGPV